MAHYDKIPALLDNLMTCSVAEAARRVGITPQTVWNYLVRSKMGDAKLQEIEFCGVVALRQRRRSRRCITSRIPSARCQRRRSSPVRSRLDAAA